MKTPALLILISFSCWVSAQDTLVISAENKGISDAWIWSYPVASNLNFGIYNAAAPDFHKVIRTESWQWQANRDDTIRTLLQFELGDLKAGDILSAELNLFHYSNPGFTKQVGANAFDMHLILEAWDEKTVTWNNQPKFSAEVGASFAASISDSQDYEHLDVTALIKSYLAVNAQGVLLKLNGEQPFAGLSFASTEHPDPLLRPVLRLVVDASSGQPELLKPLLECTPNPANDMLNISVNPTITKSLSLTDANGRQVWQVEVNAPNYTLSVGHLPKGVYVLRADGGLHFMERKVVIR